MNNELPEQGARIRAKLDRASSDLDVSIPAVIADFIEGLRDSEVEFGKESWLFGTVAEVRSGRETGYIQRMSRMFKEDWGIDGLIFASNGVGDYMLLLVNDEGTGFRKEIYVVDHEEAMIKLLAPSWNDLLARGPEDWVRSDDFLARLDDEDNLVWKKEES